FYRLWRPQVETSLALGDSIQSSPAEIVLAGYDLTTNRGLKSLAFEPSDEVTLRLYWQTHATPRLNYSLFVHLCPLREDTLLAQADGSPGVPDRPTSTWDDRSETIIGQPFVLKLPPGLSPGHYRIVVGLYDSATGHRLITPEGTTQIELAVINVT